MDNSEAHDLVRRAQGNMTASLIAFVVVMSCICLTIVSLRFYVRIQVIRNLGNDDWAVAATMLMLLGSVIGVAIAIAFGLGRHVVDVSDSHLSVLLTLMWFSGLGYHLTIIILKCAFILQYRRAFPLPAFQRICDIFLGFIACWFVAFFIAPIVICLPVRSQWDPNIIGQDYCSSRWKVWLAHGIIHVITDVVIFAMPLPLIKTLPLTKPQKITLTAVFCLGFITCIISAIRISTVHRGLFDADASWVMTRTVYWSVGEITCAMLCLCIPVLRPLLGGRANLRRWRSGAQVEVVETRGHAHFTLDSTQTWTAPAPSNRTASRGSVRSSRDIEMRENTQDRRHEAAKRTSDPPTTGTESSGAGSTWKSDDSHQRADGSWL
ncbi:hypothetical protein D7B24_000547 [Verticillium nonalfalfae]|uniref:Rhodopsin domain-containing protein n=1 Tax=Verticillium nonalfalfae TaxID=1051616 RepID=A0A3M9Y291_9PEZI|nr:uncharacterized protein D7B24_000547 [Verticillium nonalfalfae]RNJ54371.1 hypothetical protein D7B24_000547 [Verticillium nonalfalfae]